MKAQNQEKKKGAHKITKYNNLKKTPKRGFVCAQRHQERFLSQDPLFRRPTSATPTAHERDGTGG